MKLNLMDLIKTMINKKNTKDFFKIVLIKQ